MERKALVIGATLCGVTVALVGISLRREPPPAFPVTPPAPREVGADLVGPVRVTVDASDPNRWVYFDFSRASVVERPGPLDWDLGFRRFHVMVNGGQGFAGDGAVVDLGEAEFQSVTTAPDSGWVRGAARGDSVHPALARWYDYGFTSHLLTPRPRVYALRTADRRFARLRFLSYYCTGAAPGCPTIEYVYQGNGSRDLDPTRTVR